MNLQETLDFIHSVNWQGHRPGLTRITKLLHDLGDPQKELRFVHVAGTNGKGSTCACLDAILRAAGLRTGLYTSPFLEKFNERFQVDGTPISDQELCDITAQLKPVVLAQPETPTEFEVITALAMLYFARQHCDLVVLEVGLGGTLDPTNVIDTPEAAVITALGLDHVQFLGDTLPKIAAAKAGIIKAGGTVVNFGSGEQADAVIAAQAEQMHAALRTPDWSALRVTALEPDHTGMDYKHFRDLHLPLLALYQPKNAALAVETALILREKGWKISDEAIYEGIRTVRWSGRFELLRTDPPFLLDGSHNPQGIQATAESLAARYPGKSFRFLLGVMADKDIAGMLRPLAPLAAGFVAVTPHSPRALAAQELALAITHETGIPAESAQSIEEGVALLLRSARPEEGCCCLGSLYFSAQIRHAALPLL